MAGGSPEVGISSAREATFFKTMRFVCTRSYVSYQAAGMESGLGPAMTQAWPQPLVEGRPQPEATIHKLSFYVDESIAFAKTSGFA